MDEVGDDSLLAEFERLIKVAEMHWTTELAQCRAMLALLPDTLVSPTSSPERKALVLQEVLYEVAAQAYKGFKRDRRDVAVSRTLAGGAVVGIVTDDPCDDPLPATLNRKRRVASIEYRLGLAGKWLYPPVVHGKSFKPHLDNCLLALKSALVLLLEDVGAVEKLARKQGSTTSGVAPAVPPGAMPIEPTPPRKPVASAVNAGPFPSIEEHNPIDLGVHQAIDSEAADPLPLYFVRAHDKQVRQFLSTGSNVMVVLVSKGSSTGKTRACYEAIKECVPHWSLFHPVSAETLKRVLQEGQLAPQTIIWLDEITDYLQGEEARDVAKGLANLLTDPRQPVIVIGTTWFDRWYSLRGENPRPENIAIVPEVKHLLHLSRVHRIRVPEDFSKASAEELEELEKLARQDVRLRTVLQDAGPNKRVMQVLGGGPLLVEMYEHMSDPYTKAVITAAMDFVSYLPSTVIPMEFFEKAAPAYLSDEQRVAPADWLTVALDKATSEYRGVRALTPLRAQAGVGEPDTFRLHDYLERHSSKTRRVERVPRSVYEYAVQESINNPHRLRLITGSGGAGKARLSAVGQYWMATLE